MPGQISTKSGKPQERPAQQVVYWLLLLLTVVPVLILTLSPASEMDRTGNGFFCLLCGYTGTANLIRNVILFFPLGVAVALLLGPGLRAFCVPFLLTVLIEGLQVLIPGRNPGFVDIAANFSGGAFAIALVYWSPLWVWPGVRRSALWSALWAGVAGGLIFFTAYLFSPDLPDETYFGHWTPDLRHLGHYDGKVLSVTAGDSPIGVGPILDFDGVGAALNGGSVRISAEAGTPTSELSPIFMITSESQERIWLLGVDGEDAVIQTRYQADRLRMDRTELRIEEAFRGVPYGSAIDLEFTYQGGASCFVLNGRRDCGLGPRLEEGWSFLLYPRGAPAWAMSVFDFIWMMGLVLPYAFFARRHLFSYVGGGVLLVALTSGWWLAPLAPTVLPGWLGGGSGFGIGLLLRKWAGHTVKQ